MPSQEDYLDSLLKNLERDDTDINNMQENESFAGGSADADTLIEDAVSKLEAAFDSDDNSNLEKLLGLESIPEPDQEMLSEPDAGSEVVQTSKQETDELDLDEIYSDIDEILGGNGEMAANPKVSSAEQDDMPDLEVLSSMTEDEIERLISAGAEGDSASFDKESLSDDEELLKMLGGLDDDDLQDIHEMLHRADNNEAVDESLLQRNSDNENEPGGLPGREDDLQNALSEKEKRAQQKELRKQERAAAKAKKAAAKAAAKAEKAAAKAAAKAEKMSAKTGAAVAGGASESIPGETAATMNDKKGSPSTLFDTSLLDSIVAGAEQAGSELKETVAPDEAESVNYSEDAEGASAAQDGNDSDVFDNMDSLFEGSGNTDPVSQDDSKNSDLAVSNTGKADAAISKHEEPEPKKGGLLTKIFDFLTEEEEEEESASLQLSEENLDILNDLDKENAGAKNKKKKKDASGANKGGKGKEKAKKSNEKKPKAPAKPKKPKKTKPEKPKKEKTPEPEPLIPERKLTLKRVMPIVLVCVSFGVFIIVLINASVDFMDKQTATEAYYAGDYQTCFRNLYGKDLNETEQLMFGKSESILYIRLWLREYEMFAQDGAEVEALDSLLQTVDDYPKLYDYAVQWDAGAEVSSVYQTILSILLDKYGLTEEQAREIAAESSDRKYTRMIVEIVQGNAFDSRNEQIHVSESSTLESEQTTLQDVLPEEEGLGEGEFIGN